MAYPNYIEKWCCQQPDVAHHITKVYDDDNADFKEQLKWLWDNGIHKFHFRDEDVFLSEPEIYLAAFGLHLNQLILFDDDTDAMAFKCMWP